MRKIFLFLFLLLISSTALSQTTFLLPQGGIGKSCNAVTAATSANPGTATGCAALALVTSGGVLPGNYTWQTLTTGSPASVSVTLVGSLDGVTGWTTLDTNTSTTGSTKTVASSNAYRFLGCVPGTMSGGSSPTITCQVSVTSMSPGGMPTGTAFVAPTLTVSTAGSGNGQLALSGNTSGTATLTAPAVAGTTTNPIVISNNIQLPVGTAAAPSIVSASAGGWSMGGNTVNHVSSAAFITSHTGNGIITGSGRTFSWSSNANPTAAGQDTGLSRGAAGVVDVDTTAIGNSQGIIKALRHDTDTNCASSGGTCGSASSGSVSIAASASTVTVATTSVTANSVILLTRDDTLGTKLSVTCNTATAAGDIKVSTRTAATSFVITVQNAPATNPLCLNYLIIN